MFGYDSILAVSVDIASLFLLAALGLSFARLAMGPTAADRVVALDLINILAVAYSALFAVFSDIAAFLDAAIALALVAFLATVAFARFTERRTGGDHKIEPQPDKQAETSP